jgi:hypothetical protein
MSQEAHKLTNVNVNHIEDFVLADDTKVQSKGAGYLSQLGNDLVHIQDFGDNLLAPKKLFDKGIATIILARDDQIEVKVKQALAYGSVVANQFRVSLSTVHPTVNLVSSLFEREPAPTPAMSKGLSREDGIKLAFARSGYQNPSRLITAVKQNLVTGLNLPTDINSEDFHFIGNHNGYQIAKARAKQHRKRKGGRNKPTSPFEKIYFDLAVPNINSYRKDTCAIVIVCAFSGWKVFIPLKHRSEVAEKLRDWHQQWVIPNNFHINIVRCDNAPEHKSWKFNDFLNEVTAHVEYTNPYNSASNGVAERAIQTISATGRALRITAGLPIEAWAEADKTATFLENRLPSRHNHKLMSPYEVITGTRPDLSYLRPFGCKSYVYDPTAPGAVKDRA